MIREYEIFIIYILSKMIKIYLGIVECHTKFSDSHTKKLNDIQILINQK